MSETIPVVLVGIGGYGEVYLSALLDDERGKDLRLVAVADPDPPRCRRLEELRERGIPLYDSLFDIPDRDQGRLTIISSSIHTHAELTAGALSRGSHVLCEKPAAATVEEVDRMIAESERAGRWVAVGFQWSFTRSILTLKHDIRAGIFGTPRRLKTLTLWPRDDAYYARNDWAGRLRAPDGRWILDSPANNAMAHDLHNLLFLLGNTEDRSAHPTEVEAETWRAFDIETFDTIAARVHTREGPEILFFASHVTEESRDPTFVIECDGGVIRYDGGTSPIVATLSDGTTREYPSPSSEDQTCKLWTCARAVEGASIPCGLQAARAHTEVIGALRDGSRPRSFSTSLARRVHHGSSNRVLIKGLGAGLLRCFEEERLPRELGLDWSAE
jgi:predicted dehydrogenase